MFQKTLTGGRYNESNYPVQELWRKRGGGQRRIFEGGVLAGHYSISIKTTLARSLADCFVVHPECVLIKKKYRQKS